MESLVEKPPWKNMEFFKSNREITEIQYEEFDSNISIELLNKKEEINVFEKEHKWELAKKLANPYEMIYTQEEKFPHPNISLIKPLSRSYFKLIEILHSVNFFKDLSKDVQHLRSVHIAEGPGGFIQAFIDIAEQNKKQVKKIYAITLKSDKQYIPGWKKASYFLKKYSDIINISYGQDGTGDIYKRENQLHFIGNVTQKVHLFTADGGFDFSIDYTQQEKQIFQLLLCSFIICFQTLSVNGLCVIKLFDTYSPSTKTLLSLCGSCFKEYSIYKPATSRPCNSERYFIGKKYKSNKVLPILLEIYMNIQKDIYPKMTISDEEAKYIQTISDEFEQKQMECIDLAKNFAEHNENNELYKKYYPIHYQMCIKFCEEFKIPMRPQKIMP